MPSILHVDFYLFLLMKVLPTCDRFRTAPIKAIVEAYMTEYDPRFLVEFEQPHIPELLRRDGVKIAIQWVAAEWNIITIKWSEKYLLAVVVCLPVKVFAYHRNIVIPSILG